MRKKPKFRYDKDGKSWGFLERLARYECDDFDRFRQHVEEHHAARRKTAHKLHTKLEGFLSDELRELDSVSELAD